MNEEISLISMLYNTNILGYIGSENNKNHKKNILVIWDEHQKKILSELRFSENILNLKLRRDKIIVICLNKIYVFNLETFQTVDIIKTGENTNSIIGVNYSLEKTILAYPSKNRGKIQIKNYDKSKDILVDAHEKNIAIVTLTYNGDLMASATEMGTIIRIFDTNNGSLLKEVRRGKEKALIKYICFDESNILMAASSTRGTVHIWSVASNLKSNEENEKAKDKDNKIELSEKQENEEIKKIQNRKSFLSLIPNLFGDFFNSEWSFAQVRIKDTNTICCFGDDNTIIIVGINGIYYKAKIPIEKGGDCQIIQEQKF